MTTTPMVFTVLHVDRHADPEVHVFFTEDAAISRARELTAEFDRFHDAYQMAIAGWLYYAAYGDGNSIRVQARPFHGAIVPKADYEIVDAETPVADTAWTRELRARQSIAALPFVAHRCADALNTIAELEDERALIKPQAIRRLMDSGAASSATAAYKIVEADPEYAAHRRTQRDAEIEKWAAAASYESAKLTAALDVALCRAMERAD